MKALIDYFARRHTLVAVLVLVALAAGLLGARGMNAETMPDVDVGIVTITTSYPSAGPEDVELAVTEPIEDEVEDVSGIAGFTSVSSEGLSVITVELDEDLGDDRTEEIVADLREAADRASSRLPDSVSGPPTVTEASTDEIAVMEVHVWGPVPEAMLRAYTERVDDALSAVPGVGRISRVGYRERELRVLLDPAQLHRRALAIDDVTRAIRAREVRSNAGTSNSYTTERQVLTLSGFEEPGDLGSVIVRSGGFGNDVVLGELGRVVDAFEDWRIQARSSGKLAVFLQVRKKRSADSIETSAAIRERLEAMNESLPPGIRVDIVNDTSRFTRDMLDTLVDNAVLGIALVFVVLLFFFDLRTSFWVAAGLPVSVGLSMAGMYVFGYQLDLITLMTLLLMLGMLVDDAIVTGESVYQRREAGLPPPEAAIEGTHAVTAPVITSMATTVFAFAPILFITGIQGKLFRPVPFVVALTLAASLIECKLMLPAHLGGGGETAPRRWFDRVRGAYARMIGVVLRLRVLALVGFIGLVAALTVLAVVRMPINLFPSTDADNFAVKLELPSGTSLQTTARRADEVGARLAEAVGEDDLLGVATQVGHHDVGLGSSERRDEWALINVYLRPAGSRTVTSDVLMKRAEAALDDLEGLERIEVVSRGGGPTSGNPIEVSIRGSLADRLAISDLLMTFLRGQAGVTAVETSYAPGKAVVEVNLDHRALQAHGVDPQRVTDLIAATFDGVALGGLRVGNESVSTRVSLAATDVPDLESLRGLTVLNSDGYTVPLVDIVSLTERAGAAEVRRVDGLASLTVSGEIDRAQVQVDGINERIAEFLKARNVATAFPEARVELGGEIEQQAAAMDDLLIAAAACLGLIFLVLLLLFGSITQPLLVMTVIPFGVAGALVGLSIQGLDLSLLVGVGVLGLAGVLVNDSVVMVDALNERRGDEAKLEISALAEGAVSRLRPVVLTSVTTTVGLVPTILGANGSTQFIVPMISTLAWGVGLGSVITLFFIPVAYALEQDVRVGISGLVKRWRG